MITIIYNGNNYYLQVNNLKFDPNIADYLDLTEEEYQDILIKEGALLIDEECYFKYKKDAEKVLKELEPYEILAKLIK